MSLKQKDMMRVILGLIIAGIGVMAAIKSEAIYSFFGPVAFFEKYLGTEGGSRLGYKLAGILIFFIGVMIATNVFSEFMGWILSPLINAGQGGGF
jgi:hypothetical protein